MTDQTLLAAVRAAAHEPASALDASTQQTQEISMAGQNDPALAPAKITSIADLRAAHPDLCAALATEVSTAAALAERERIIGIEAIAPAGHEKLVADLKADGKTTPDQAAAAILRAEKATRGGQMSNIQNVETAVAGVKPAPSAGGHDQTQVADTPEAWKAEYAKSADLQAEFGSPDVYVSFKQGEAEGRIHRLNKKSA
jgi:hypothetical protein